MPVHCSVLLTVICNIWSSVAEQASTVKYWQC